MKTTTEVDLLCPIMPYDLDRDMRRRWENLIERVSARAVIQGRGHDLLLYIYLAGFYHGVTIQQERALAAPTERKEPT